MVPERDVIAVLAEYWQEALPYFSTDDLTLLAGLIAVIAAATEDEEAARGAFADLMAVLALRLPLEHPVSRAMTQQVRYAAAHPADLSGVAETLRLLPGLDSLLRVPIAAADDPYSWLLSAPALTE
jgi:hypothetical protein